MRILVMTAFLTMTAGLPAEGSDVKEAVDELGFESGEKARFEIVVPDAEWGEPLFLYSRNGVAYRCFIKDRDFPLACRRTFDGEETRQAMDVLGTGSLFAGKITPDAG